VNKSTDVIYSAQENLTVTFADAMNLPMTLMVNGFSIKETVVEALEKFTEDGVFADMYTNEIAEAITALFGVKLNMFQGSL